MKNFLLKIGFVLTMSLLLAGCQAATQNVQPAASTQEVQHIPNTPYIKGPSSPPGLKGPTQPFPGTSAGAASSQQNQPQAMTEKVNQKFTLNS